MQYVKNPRGLVESRTGESTETALSAQSTDDGNPNCDSYDAEYGGLAPMWERKLSRGNC
jgi:hypothetical protein